MPTYDYECDACGHQFEAFQSMRDDALSVCPECNESALRRLITGGTGVIFKGSGFYVNDSKGKNAATKKTNSSTAAEGSSGDKSSSEATSSASETSSTSTKDTKSGDKKSA